MHVGCDSIYLNILTCTHFRIIVLPLDTLCGILVVEAVRSVTHLAEEVVILLPCLYSPTTPYNIYSLRVVLISTTFLSPQRAVPPKYPHAWKQNVSWCSSTYLHDLETSGAERQMELRTTKFRCVSLPISHS
jgi:hypothetical protein